MSSDEFRFMLWEQDCDGTWKLRRRSKTRDPVEREAATIPQNAVWRFVSQYHGVLAESVTRT